MYSKRLRRRQDVKSVVDQNVSVDPGNDWSWPSYPFPDPEVSGHKGSDDPSVTWPNIVTSSVPALPAELWELICFWISPEDLWALRFLNSTFLTMAIDAKYNSITLHQTWRGQWDEELFKQKMTRLTDPWVSRRVRTVEVTYELLTEANPVNRELAVSALERLPNVTSFSTPYPVDRPSVSRILESYSSNLLSLTCYLVPQGVYSDLEQLCWGICCPQLISLCIIDNRDSYYDLDTPMAIRDRWYVCATTRLLSLAPRGLARLALHGCKDDCLRLLLDNDFPCLRELYLVDAPQSKARLEISTVSEVLEALSKTLTALTLTVENIAPNLVTRIATTRLSRITRLVLDPVSALPNWAIFLMELQGLKGVQEVDLSGRTDTSFRYSNYLGLTQERVTALTSALSTCTRLRSLSLTVRVINVDIFVNIATSLAPHLDNLLLAKVTGNIHDLCSNCHLISKRFSRILSSQETSPVTLQFLGLARRFSQLEDVDILNLDMEEGNVRNSRAICDVFARSIDLQHFESHNPFNDSYSDYPSGLVISAY